MSLNYLWSLHAAFTLLYRLSSAPAEYYHISDAFSAFVRCDSTERLRNSLDYLRSVLNDSTSFKLIYRYAFDFARVSQVKLFPL